MKLQVIKVDGVNLPIYQSKGASGFDFESNEDLVLQPLQRAAVGTGLRFNIPKGFEIQVRTRSGLAIKHGISVLNSPGTVDSDYQGEVKVILINLSDKPFEIKKGDRIAQGVFAMVSDQVEFEVVDSFEFTTERGENGFGSTGK